MIGIVCVCKLQYHASTFAGCMLNYRHWSETSRTIVNIPMQTLPSRGFYLLKCCLSNIYTRRMHLFKWSLSGGADEGIEKYAKCILCALPHVDLNTCTNGMLHPQSLPGDALQLERLLPSIAVALIAPLV